MAQENKIDLIKEIIKESTYLFYEMKDIKKEIFLKDNVDSLGENKYEKYISPLFDSDVIDAPFNRDLLDIIFEEAPFYYKEPQGELLADSTILDSTRDPGINDVASPLQTEFWSVLFREAFGSVQNDLLLSIYNKLRYPFIGEQQYLNANLFPELAKKYFNKRNKLDKGTEIEFKNTTADNLEDIYKMKSADEARLPGSSEKKKYLGCIDYLEDIVNQKLSSIYAILDYHPDGSNLLNTWAESMLNSGRLQVENIEREKTIYKLQDIKYELLKRKFAGSSTLYSLALSSINRRGSLLKTVTVGDVFLDASSQFFMDSRALRILDMPGLLTKKHLITSVSPYDIFYTKAKNKNQEIPLGILTPLYYTSTPQDFEGSVEKAPYEADKFYMDGANELYRSKFLRGNSGVINWNKPSSPIYPDSFNYTYTVLDEFKLHRDSLTGKKTYRELDMPIEIQMPGRDPIKYEMNQLDIKIPTISSSAVTGVVLDISLDTILYHKNSLQRLVGSEYDYVTYPLSNNASLSLMDVEWMNFIKGNTEEKSRVQDNLSFGSQVSFYKKLSKTQTAFHMFYAISYGDDTDRHLIAKEENGSTKYEVEANPVSSINDLPNYSYDEWISLFKVRPKYAYLWLYSFEYKIDDFTLLNPSKRTLISKITLKVGSNNPEISPYREAIDRLGGEKDPIKDLESYIIRAYEDFNEKEVNLYNAHLGILPFTYQDLESNSILSLKTGIFEDKNNINYFDDLSDLNYNKAIFAFSDYDLLSIEGMEEPKIPSINVDKQGNKVPNALFLPFKNNALYFLKSFTEYPTANTKSVFYGIRELAGKDDKGESIYRYRWSAPINVINLHQLNTSGNNINLSQFSYKPDWMDLQFFLNPYLNFNLNSASPLRHKKVLHKGTDYVSHFLDFSNDAALCSLVKMRNKGYLCNDEGKAVNFKTEDANQLIGMYLYHNHNEDIAKGAVEVFPKLEYVDIFGDNRSPDYFDAAFSSVISRSKPYIDPDSASKKQCIGFKYPTSNFRTNTEYPIINSLQILPMNPANYPANDADKENMWNRWAWNKEKEGITVCCNVEVIPSFIRKVLTGTSEIERPGTPDTSGTIAIDKALSSVKQGNEWVILNRNREFTLSIVDIKQEKADKIEFEDSKDQNGNANGVWDLDEKGKISSYYSFRFKLTICEPAIENKKISLSPNCIDTLTSIYSEKYYIDNESQNSAFFRIAFSLAAAKSKSNKNFKAGHAFEAIFIINDRLQDLRNAGTTTAIVNGKETIKEEFVATDIYNLPGEIKNILISKPWGIDIGTSFDKEGKIQSRAFYGNIYDLRLYNRATSTENLLITSRGSTYELYSYSPSVYKLGYNIYKDLGIFKYSNIFKSTSTIPAITQIRAFNRSVWDSILVDMYPTSREETYKDYPEFKEDAKDPKDDTDIFIPEATDDSPILEDAIQQNLLDTVEVINNTQKYGESNGVNSGNGIDKDIPAVIHYNGENIFVGDKDLITTVTTMIQPTIYNKAEYISKSILVPTIVDDKVLITSRDDAPINLPILAEKGTLQYEADLNINFMLDGGTDLSMRYLAGKNVQSIWNKKLNRACVSLIQDNKERDKTANTSQNNFILTPFTLPDQTENARGNFVEGKLNRINLRGVQLNISINSFLKAINYYTEVRIPNLITRDADPENVRYASKWLAVRTLKEGSYYFTYKYPIQILPFSEKDMQSSNSAFNTYYATARFKVEVKGTPIKYDSKKYKLDTALGIYKSDTIRSTFNSDTCIEDELDNRTFPHRLIDIDLYVMNTGNMVQDIDPDLREPIEPDMPAPPVKPVKPVEPNVDKKKAAYIRYTWRMEEYEEAYKKYEKLLAAYEEEYKVWKPLHDEWEINHSEWEEKYNIVKNISSGYSWKLIGSNHNYLDDPKIIKLNKLTLKDNISISEDIPVFLAESYNGPYFTSSINPDKTPNPRSIKDDKKAAITVGTINSNFYEDKLYANKLDDFKDQRMTAGRSYRLLFDYEAQPAEITYSSYVEGSKEKEYDISFKEYRKYPESFSLLQEEGNPLTYMYGIQSGSNFVEKLLNSNTEIAEMLERTTAGFETEDIIDEPEKLEENGPGGIPVLVDTFQTGWKESSKSINTETTRIYLGNPYSSSISENMLLKSDDGSPTDIDEIFFFPYMPTEVPASNPVTIRDKKEIKAVDNFVSTASIINLSEYDVVKGVGSRRHQEVTSSILNLKKSISGIFTQLSEVFPSITYTPKYSTDKFIPEKYSYITSSDYSLFSYDTSPVSIKNNNQINIERYSLYQNNILEDQNFNHWEIQGVSKEQKGKYIPEAVFNRDRSGSSVYRMDFRNEGFIREISLIKEAFEIPKKDYFEVAVVLRVEDEQGNDVSDNITISAIFHNDRETGYLLPLKIEGSLGNLEGGFKVFSAQTSNDISLKTLEIHMIEKGLVGKNQPKTIKLYKVFLRRGVPHKHLLGLADTLIKAAPRKDNDNVLQLGNYTVIAFKKNTDKYIHNYIPIMFEGEKTDLNGIITVDPMNPSDFINKNAIPQTEKRFQSGFFTEGLTRLRQPWLRTIIFREGKQIGVDENGKFIYGENQVEILKEELINNEFKRVSGNTTNVFEEGVEIHYDNSVNNPNLSISNLKINVVPVKSRVGDYNEYMLAPKEFRMNLRVNAKNTSDSLYTPITLINEKISGLTNCFHGENFASDTYKAKSSLVEITNIQLLTPEKPSDPDSNNILFCELEYLPIIYDEAIHHISFNGMFHQVASGMDPSN